MHDARGCGSFRGGGDPREPFSVGSLDLFRSVSSHCVLRLGKKAAVRDQDRDPYMSDLASGMTVTKRNGQREPVDLNKIVRAIERAASHLKGVDTMRVATRTVSGLYDGATTRELDELSIRTAATLSGEDPEFGYLAGSLLSAYIDKEVGGQDIQSFSQSVARGVEVGLINERLSSFVEANARKLNDRIDPARSLGFEHFGLRTVYDRYLLKHPITRKVIETPQYFFMRVACALSGDSVNTALKLYELFSSRDYLPSSPTLFNSGTKREQLSSCYLLDSPEDDLSSIYDRYKDIALLSKFAGGIGVSYSRVRSSGSLIVGTNGPSSGIVPWIKTLDSSVAAVDQCFAPETMVFTADGTKAIRDIQPGDLVLGVSGQLRKVTERMVYNQEKQMRRLDIKHAIDPVCVTAGHPFYAIRGVPMEQSVERTMRQLEAGKHNADWSEAGELAKGDYVAQVIPTEVEPIEGFTEDDARLYGILLGDGHMDSRGKEWGVSGNPSRNEHLSFVREYLTARGIHFWELARGTNYQQVRWSAGLGVARDGTTGRMVGSVGPSMPFAREDLYDARGAKRIARRFSHLPRPQALALVHGLLETDGGVSRGTELYFTNTSRALVEGLRYQLLRLGVPSAGQYRERPMDHQGTRSDGSTCSFKGVCKAYDLRIPAVAEIATPLGCRTLTRKNWIQWQGHLFSRVRSNEEVAPVPFVVDLLVEGDESYMTTAGLAHNGGKRKGAACVYLESWHADIEAFLELRDNTGDHARRTHNLNIANWIPDLFMERVETDGDWSLFDPKDVPDFVDLWGDAFRARYEEAESQGLARKTVKARALWERMLRTLAETGNGWMNFKDRCNATCNQTAEAENVVHLSNLCTEIVEVTDNRESEGYPKMDAVCNLGSINLSHHVVDGKVDFEKIGDTVRAAIGQLDRVIDINYYPIPSTERSNQLWRPVGLGLMGLQDVFFKLGLPFDSPEALEVSNRISEEIYYHALSASCDLAKEFGPHSNFFKTRAANGELQFDYWPNAKVTDSERWDALRARIDEHGLRNSLMIAIAPTATIASIAGCYECIEPQTSNLFKRETLSGDFIVINRYLVDELKSRNLWNATSRDALKLGEGSVAGVEGLPDDLKHLYRTAWEVPQRALVNLAAGRGAFIDQSQSLNLFLESPTIGKLSSMYMYAWKQGVKTSYYLRSRPATKIAKATLGSNDDAGTAPPVPAKDFTPAEALACSLENPESCEACQ